MHTARLAVVLALGTALSAQSSRSVEKKIVAEGLENSRVMDFQDHLCNTIGHRLTGSENFRKACEWARAELEAMGLDARLEPWAEWKTGWDRGQWMGRMVEPESIEFQVATPAWSAPTKGDVRGEIVAMPVDEAGVQALAARVEQGERLYLYRQPAPPPAEGSDGRERPRRPPVPEPVQQWIAAGDVLGVVESSRAHGYADARFENQIRVFGDRNAAMRAFDDRPVTPHIVLRDDHAAKLEAALQGEAKVVVEFDVRNRFRRGPIEVHNVVADLKGSRWPDQVVIVCGHLDSWHQATGATDNGTGTCSTLEAARILTAAGVRPRRTIRFILWGGEEQGLLGSRQYVVRHRQEMDDVSAVFNHDSGTNWAHTLTVTKAMYPALEDVFAPILALPAPDPRHEGPTFVLNQVDELRPARGGSDHASFAAVGVPAFAWGLRGDLPYGYGWHSQWDTYRLVVPEYQRHNATVFALAAYGVANLPKPLSRENVLRRDDSGGDARPLNEGRLGVRLDGMKVTAVEDGGLAAAAGVEVGDVIVAVFGTAVQSAAELATALRENARRRRVTIRVSRGGQELDLETARRRRR